MVMTTIRRIVDTFGLTKDRKDMLLDALKDYDVDYPNLSTIVQAWSLACRGTPRHNYNLTAGSGSSFVQVQMPLTIFKGNVV